MTWKQSIINEPSVISLSILILSVILGVSPVVCHSPVSSVNFIKIHRMFICSTSQFWGTSYTVTWRAMSSVSTTFWLIFPTFPFRMFYIRTGTSAGSARNYDRSRAFCFIFCIWWSWATRAVIGMPYFPMPVISSLIVYTYLVQ